MKKREIRNAPRNRQTTLNSLPHRTWKPQRLIGALAIAWVCCVSTPVWAAVVAPAGLNPGDTFRLVFVTSTFTSATATEIAYYDDFVTASATAAGLDTYNGAVVSWQAIGSFSDTPAVLRVPATSNSSPIYRLDGAIVATSGADL